VYILRTGIQWNALPRELGASSTVHDRFQEWEVVERTHSWLNRSRRLLVRWEKKAENYLAFLHLACAQLIFTKVAVFG